MNVTAGMPSGPSARVADPSAALKRREQMVGLAGAGQRSVRDRGRYGASRKCRHLPQDGLCLLEGELVGFGGRSVGRRGACTRLEGYRVAT